MNVSLKKMTQEWMQLERKTIEQRKVAEKRGWKTAQIQATIGIGGEMECTRDRAHAQEREAGSGRNDVADTSRPNLPAITATAILCQKKKDISV